MIKIFSSKNKHPLRRIIFLMLYSGIITILSAPASNAQGSGDAGIQMSGDMDPRARGLDTPSRIYILQSAGLGADNTICLTSELQMDWNIWGGINIWFAVPYQFNTGNLATVYSMGDLRLILSHTLAEGGNFTVKLNFGGIIPSGNANSETDGKPLPMVYQTSQGNYSLLVSANFFYASWALSAGYQWHVSGSRNGYTRSAWDNAEDMEEYPDSPGLWSGDDLAFKVQKNFDRQKAHYFIRLLPALRLNEDLIKQEGEYVSLEDSRGFYLNVSAGAEITMGKNGYFHFLAAVPILERDVYPDGLDRVFLVTAGFGVRFPE